MNKVVIKKIESIMENLTETEQLDIIVYVSSKLKNRLKGNRPRDLLGFLNGKVDPNFDVERALKEIRKEWLEIRIDNTNE